MTLNPESEYQRLTVYIGESDQWHGRPLWQALLEHLVREGFAGATVLRGLAGFGAHSRIKTASVVNLSADLPLVCIVVDRADRIERSLPGISAMVGEGLITLEPMSVVKYSYREAPLLPADRRVRDLMTRDVVTVRPGDSLAEVARLLLASHFSAVPVVDSSRHVVGIVSDGDFLAWPELALRFRTPERLRGTNLGELLVEVDRSGATTRDIMTTGVVTVREDQAAAEAGHLMVQRGLKTLPVIDREGRLTGIISRIDILRGVVHDAPSATPLSPPPHDLYLLRDVVRRDVPTIGRDAPLGEIVARMLTSDLNRVIVVDAERRPLGVITDGDLVARVQPPVRRGVVQALWRRVGLGGDEPGVADRATGSEQCAGELMSCPVLTAPEDTPIRDAIRLLVEEKRRRLVALDGEGRLVGIADRRNLLRALVGGAIHG